MSKLFAVVVATVPEYYEYKKEHPEHDQDQLEWFKQQYEIHLIMPNKLLWGLVKILQCFRRL